MLIYCGLVGSDLHGLTDVILEAPLRMNPTKLRPLSGWQQEKGQSL